MPKLNRKIVVAVSDLHSGFTLGLTNPDTPFLDAQSGTTKQLETSEHQRFLWSDVYLWGIEQTRCLADKDNIYVFGIGDLTHGNHFNSEQITTRMADQFDAAFYALLPLINLKNIKVLRWCIGTGGHVFGEGTSEIVTINRIKDKFPKLDARIGYHGLYKLGALDIDYAHHGPHPGSRNWLVGNEARLYLKSMMLSDLDAGEKPADLVLRGHYHTFVREWCGISRDNQFYESWLVIMPSLCLLGDYGHKATRSIYRLSPGMIAFEIINDKLYAIHPFIKHIDIRMTEESGDAAPEKLA